jgi:hypothetical protein
MLTTVIKTFNFMQEDSQRTVQHQMMRALKRPGQQSRKNYNLSTVLEEAPVSKSWAMLKAKLLLVGGSY